MSLPALYELAADYVHALRDLASDEWSAETDADAVRDTLDALRDPLERKATNIAMYTRNLEAMADAIKAAEEQMSARRKAIEHRAAWLRDYIKHNLELAQITRIESPHFVVAIRQNPPHVCIDDAMKIPAEYMTIPSPPPPMPDKTAIKAAIQRDERVPGAHLEVHTRLEIR